METILLHLYDDENGDFSIFVEYFVKKGTPGDYMTPPDDDEIEINSAWYVENNESVPDDIITRHWDEISDACLRDWEVT